MDKKQELLQVSTQLMAALITGDHIAWSTDPENISFESHSILAAQAVHAAKELIDRVDREFYQPFRPSQMDENL